jgi:hypothetical protein
MDRESIEEPGQGDNRRDRRDRKRTGESRGRDTGIDRSAKGRRGCRKKIEGHSWTGQVKAKNCGMER